MSANDTYRIGQVCRMLRADFPDVTISKIRFLEDKGLVEPQRTPGGYRVYTEEHLAQLRQILTMQRDEFLPLRVIREELQRRLAGGPARRQPARRVSLTRPLTTLSMDELCQRLQVGPQLVEECEQHGLVTAIHEDGERYYALDDCEIVAAAGQVAKYGIEIDSLAKISACAGATAEVITGFAAPRVKKRNGDERAAAVRGVESLTDAMLELVRRMVVRDVRDGVLDEQAPLAASRGGRS